MIKINSIKLFYFFIIISSTAILPTPVSASRILAVFGLPAPARYDFVAALLNALSDRGHQVTLILRFPSEWKLRENITQIIIKENQPILTEFTYFSSNYMDDNFFNNLQIIFGNCTSMNRNILKNSQVKLLMQEQQQQFDLILLDILLSDSLYGLGEHFNAPMVGVSNYCTWLTVDKLVGNISPVSFIPSVFIQHTFEVNFMQRCLNFALDMINEMVYNFMYLNQQHMLYKELFPNASQTFEEVRRNFSLVILNHHVSLSFPRPYVPNMIEAAGLHIVEENLPELPLPVQQFISSSNQSVIYFYLDINPSIFQLSPEQTLQLCNAFKDLNYKVIWHHNSNMPFQAKYENILYVSNVSHFALLAQPQVKLFMTSGEKINFIEAVYYAKPLLGIPVFANDRLNINMAINGGYGLGLSLQQLSASKLKLLIVELLTKPQYQLKIKQLSALLHDQPLKPKELAIYWIEYVLRHKGAMHLRVKGRFLSFWQFHNIDVILAFIAVFTSIVFCIRWLMECIHYLMHRNRKTIKIKIKIN